MDLTKIGRMAGESEPAYIYRIIHLKGSIPEIKTWQDAADILNLELGYDYTESAYRKRVQEFDKLYEELRGGFLQDTYLQLIDQKREAMYKQQVKTGDKLREYRKHLRDEARVEILTKAIEEAAHKLPPIKIKTVRTIAKGEKKEAVVLISDWHIGAKFDNFMNQYDLETAWARVGALIGHIQRYVKVFGITRLTILNLGDMIEGNIHVSVRVQSEIDAVEQTIQASEMVAHFLTELESCVEEIYYGDVLDNHSRIYSRKEEHIEKESFAKITNWWLKTRLAASESKVQFLSDIEFVDENIGVLTLMNGKRAGFVHGHLDRINQVFQNLNGLLRETLDYIFMGHYHVAKMKEFNGGKVFVNGSLKGVDPYALNNRYTGRASQFMLVFDGENEVPIVINVN